jgi:hypothetical protein
LNGWLRNSGRWLVDRFPNIWSNKTGDNAMALLCWCIQKELIWGCKVTYKRTIHKFRYQKVFWHLRAESCHACCSEKWLGG